MSKRDKLLYKFLGKDYGDPFKDKDIDPDDMNYQSPDFGFDDHMVFEEEPQTGSYSHGWKCIGDYVSRYSRFERVVNYIKFVNKQKNQEEAQNKKLLMQKTSTLTRPSKKMKPAEQQDFMRRLKEEMQNNKSSKNAYWGDRMQKFTMKVAEMEMELENLNSKLIDDTSFVQHLKSLAK